jgi:hypothetical protein
MVLFKQQFLFYCFANQNVIGLYKDISNNTSASLINPSIKFMPFYPCYFINILLLKNNSALTLILGTLCSIFHCSVRQSSKMQFYMIELKIRIVTQPHISLLTCELYPNSFMFNEKHDIKLIFLRRTNVFVPYIKLGGGGGLAGEWSLSSLWSS